MKMKLLIISLVLLSLIIIGPESSEGYRILGVFPLNSRSHFIMFEALMKGLARKGHQVDVISPFPLKKPLPNYTDIISLDKKAGLFVNNISYNLVNEMSGNFMHFVATDIGNELCKNLEDPRMLKLIDNPPKDPPYDLLLTEVFGAHCYMALGYHLNIPTIGMSSAVIYPWLNRMIGNPANLAFVPNNLLNYAAPMTFWERFYNTVHTVYNDIMFRYYTTQQTDIIKKYFGPNAPSVRECERNLALVLTNSHFVLNDPQPNTPKLIEVGGLHVQDDGIELPKDLKKWMDDSKDGFVYFTFGSMVVIESFPEEIVHVFFKSLEKIAPIRVLIKIPYPEKLSIKLSENVRTFVWASQFKIFQHKNVKAFITHGGLMGGQEAIRFGIPMIAIPLFADQFRNADQYVRKKIGIKLNFWEITEQTMDYALHEILHNPSWKNTAVKLSQKFLDRPMSSMDTAIWWVEYVIRHGNDVLKSHAMDLTWWQIELFDVYAVLLSIAVLALFVIFKLIKIIINLLSTLCPYYYLPRSAVRKTMEMNSKKTE